MKYAIRLVENGMFLRDESSDDAYTDDLDEATLYNDYAEARSICASEEEVVSVTSDGVIEVVN